LGVTVSNLVCADGAPFLLESLERGRKAARAMDEINERFGKGTIRRAKVLEAERFGAREAPSQQKPRFS
jgi:hypothetical protein